MTSFTWDIEPERAFTELTERFVEEVHQGALALAYRYAPQIETWMKENHVWQNQTGEAERQLHAEVIELTGAIVVSFGHGVDYGAILETMQAGRFSVISPALDYFAPKIWVDVQRLLEVR